MQRVFGGISEALECEKELDPKLKQRGNQGLEVGQFLNILD